MQRVRKLVGSSQHVVSARARDPREAVVQYYLEYLGSWHPDIELEGGARSVVRFEGILRKLHHSLRMGRWTLMDRSMLL